MPSQRAGTPSGLARAAEADPVGGRSRAAWVRVTSHNGILRTPLTTTQVLGASPRHAAGSCRRSGTGAGAGAGPARNSWCGRAPCREIPFQVVLHAKVDHLPFLAAAGRRCRHRPSLLGAMILRRAREVGVGNAGTDRVVRPVVRPRRPDHLLVARAEQGEVTTTAAAARASIRASPIPASTAHAATVVQQVPGEEERVRALRYQPDRGHRHDREGRRDRGGPPVYRPGQDGEQDERRSDGGRVEQVPGEEGEHRQVESGPQDPPDLAAFLIPSRCRASGSQAASPASAAGTNQNRRLSRSRHQRMATTAA